MAVLFCAVVGVSSNAAHLLLDMDHKPVERIYHNLEVARSQYVTQKEKDIVFGRKWEDVEVDEVDIGKLTDESVAGNLNTKWEQWGGLVERGRPSSLVLFRLNPILTKKRSPGPGPIRKRDWQPIAKKHIAGRKVILHSDGARAYKLRLPDVRHCNVVHKKKRIVINGKASNSDLNCFNCLLRDLLDCVIPVCQAVWVKPHYTKQYDVKLPDGKKVRVKSGTQIIDRFWNTLRSHLKHTNRIPGSQVLLRKLRSAQFEYWHRRANMWEVTGQMLQALHKQ